MKKLLYCLIAASVLSACQKENVKTDNIVICLAPPVDTLNIPDGCISRLYFEPAKTTLSAADFSRSAQLFQQNNISTNSLHFYRYAFDACANCAIPGPYETVRANQFFNGQLVFNDEVLYNFRQGAFNVTNGRQFNSIALDTVPATSLKSIRKLFVNLLNIDTSIPNKTLKEGCMVAQFGYYDLNGGSSSLTPGNFAKCWKITPKGSEYPVAYFMDDKPNTLIYYFNGIMTGM